MFYVHLYLGKVSNLTSIFFKWVVQPATRNLRFGFFQMFFLDLQNVGIREPWEPQSDRFQRLRSPRKKGESLEPDRDENSNITGVIIS